MSLGHRRDAPVDLLVGIQEVDLTKFSLLTVTTEQPTIKEKSDDIRERASPQLKKIGVIPL